MGEISPQANHGDVKKVLAIVALASLAGCASNPVGGPPASETGSGRSAPLQTETLTPGVGSALFPDPGWPQKPAQNR